MSKDSPLKRRSVLKSVGAISTLGIVGAGSVSSLPGDSSADSSTDGTTGVTSWPQYQGNPAKTGFAGTGPTVNNQLWQYKTVDDDREFSRPVVTEDAIFSINAPRDSDGFDHRESGGHEILVALSHEGEELWTYDTPEQTWMDGDLAYSDGYLYVGGASTDFEECTIEEDGGVSVVLKVDTETGELVDRWSKTGKYGTFYSITVADGFLFGLLKGAGMGDHTLVAFATESGEERWTFDIGAGSNSTVPPVAVKEGVVYVAGEELTAIDAETGSVNWESEESPVYMREQYNNSPAIVDGVVYTSGQATVAAYDAADGTMLWEAQTEGQPSGPVAVGGDSLYVSFAALESGFSSGTQAFNLDDGSEEWFTDEVGSRHPIIVGDEFIYLDTAAVEPETGEVVWDHEQAGDIAVAGDRMYFGGYYVAALGEQ